MKKALLLGILAVGAISFWSCSKEEASGKESAQIAKEALESVKDKPTPESLDIEMLQASWAKKAINVETENGNFKQFVAYICAQHPQFYGNYEILRYLSDEKGYSNDKYEIKDEKDKDFIKFSPKEDFTFKDKSEIKNPTDTIFGSVTFQTWEYDNGQKVVGVLYQRYHDYLINFYNYSPKNKELQPNQKFFESVQHHIDRAVLFNYKKVLLTGGSNIEFVKQKENKEEYYFDHWDGSGFQNVTVQNVR